MDRLCAAGGIGMGGGYGGSGGSHSGGGRSVPPSLDRPARSTTTVPRGTIRSGGLGLALAQSTPVSTSTPTAQRPLQDAEVEREYGGRFLADYTRKQLLGKGACGAVWLATASANGALVAVKQVAKGAGQKQSSDTRSAVKEICIGEMLFHPGGAPKISPSQYPGIRNITRLIDAAETKNDIFMVMEYGGVVLSKLLFDIKGEFVARGSFQPRERVYRVHHLPFYEAMKRDPRVLKRLLRQILCAIHALSEHRIVHADLKPDNILIESADGDDNRSHARLCDFGSAFVVDEPEPLALATPEYMPPEALEACIAGHSGDSGGGGGGGSGARSAGPAWAFDIWSVGAILLELSYGVPHWLSYKCRVRGLDPAKDHSVTGLFAVQSRDHDRILQRQQEIVADGGLRRILRDPPGIVLGADGLDLLEAMLAWDPTARISPAAALAHPFLRA